MRNLSSILGIFCLGLTLLPVSGFSAETGTTPQTGAAQSSSQSTIEMHQKMAGMHAQMAACMQSSKPMQPCHEEMMKDHCPMMGQMGGMKDQTQKSK